MKLLTFNCPPQGISRCCFWWLQLNLQLNTGRRWNMVKQPKLQKQRRKLEICQPVLNLSPNQFIWFIWPIHTAQTRDAYFVGRTALCNLHLGGWLATSLSFGEVAPFASGWGVNAHQPKTNTSRSLLLRLALYESMIYFYDMPWQDMR